jgi:hypothetical protein
MSTFTNKPTNYNTGSYDEQTQEANSTVQNNEQNMLDEICSSNLSSSEAELENNQWDEIDSIYRAVLKNGQGFQSIGKSGYLGDIEIAHYDGQWHVFIEKRCLFSHPDKAELEKMYAPEVIDAELQRVDEEVYELERERELERLLAEERAEIEAERDAREHRVYDDHGYSYRVYYDDYYYDVFYHRY